MAEKSETLSLGVLHGPNLNLLGQREPAVYGHDDLETINRRVAERASELGIEISFFQSNTEGELVEWVQRTGSQCDGLLVNAAAYTHTSVALRDALRAVAVPFVEVHLSNVFAREPFRHRSLLSDMAVGLVVGFAADSYLLALDGIVAYLRRR